MALNLRTPGVYIEEVARFPPSVVPVETAIPVFLGYTERTSSEGLDLIHRPVAINSFLDFRQIFGEAPAVGGFVVSLDPDGKVAEAVADPNRGPAARFRLANAVRHFYDNGGGRCFVTSLGGYGASGVTADVVASHLAGLAAAGKEDEPTLVVMPDLSAIAPAGPSEGDLAAARAAYHGVLVQALDQCATLGDRFLIGEIWGGDQPGSAGIDAFRDGIGIRNLKYGAIYHPFIHTTLPWRWNEATITLGQLASRNADGSLTRPGLLNGQALSALPGAGATVAYANVRQELDRYTVILPPGGAMAGIYATVDRTRGVHKSPANESLAAVRTLTVAIDGDLNDLMNVHPSGKAVNALRFFSGKGTLVWGARTLAGNDNEWRYVAVRRFFNLVEESTRKASEAFVFEPNDANTWVRVKAMIENFLLIQWRQGALAGAKSEDAFYVRVGLGVTMTAQDILEGRMNVEIGMAVVRPAEFIVLRFSHKMQEA